MASRLPLFATAIAIRGSYEHAAVAADSRRTFVTLDGSIPNEIHDDTCKICLTKLGVFVYTQIDPVFGACAMARRIADTPGINLAGAFEKIFDALIPMLKRPAESALGKFNFSAFTHRADAALIGFEDGRIKYSRSSMYCC